MTSPGERADSGPTVDAGQEDIKRLARGAGILLFGRLSGRALHLGTQMALARWLGPSAFGLYGIGWTLVVLAGTIAPLGLDRAVLRFVPTEEARRPGSAGHVIRQAVLWAGVGALALSLVAFASADFVAGSVFNKPELAPLLRVLASVPVPMALLKILAAVTRCSKDMRASVIAEDVGQPLVNLLGVAVAFLLGAGLSGAISAMTVSFIASAVLAALFVVKIFPGTLDLATRSGVAPRVLVAFAIPASGAGLFSMFAGRVDRLLVGRFLDASEVGAYHAASQISILFAIILGATNAIFAPMIPQLHEAGKTAQLRELFVVSTKWAVYVSAPFAVLVFTMPQDVMAGLYGAEFASAGYVLLILTGGMIFNVATGGVGFILMMTGHQNRYFVITSISLLWNISVNLWAIPRYGLLGAAIGSTSAVVFLVGGSLAQVAYHVRLWPYDWRYWKGMVAAAGASLASILLRTFFDLPALVMCFLGLLLVSLVFVGTLMSLGLDPEDRNALRPVGKYLRGLRARRPAG